MSHKLLTPNISPVSDLCATLFKTPYLYKTELLVVSCYGKKQISSTKHCGTNERGDYLPGFEMWHCPTDVHMPLMTGNFNMQ